MWCLCQLFLLLTDGKVLWGGDIVIYILLFVGLKNELGANNTKEYPIFLGSTFRIKKKSWHDDIDMQLPFVLLSTAI